MAAIDFKKMMAQELAKARAKSIHSIAAPIQNQISSHRKNEVIENQIGNTNLDAFMQKELGFGMLTWQTDKHTKINAMTCHSQMNHFQSLILKSMHYQKQKVLITFQTFYHRNLKNICCLSFILHHNAAGPH